MAYDASIAGDYPSKPGYQLFLYCRRDQTDNANNRSSYAWELKQRNYATNTPSWFLDDYIWYVTVGGQAWQGYADCDFRGIGYGGERSLATGSSGWFGHDSNGYLNISFACSHVTSPWGTAQASGVLYSDRIPKPPSAPGTPTFSNIQTTSVEVYVPGSNTSNGSPIDQYLVRISKNSNPEVAPFSDYNANLATGRVTIPNLDPGAKYYVKAYAHNAMGYTPGPVASFTTLSGAYIGKDGGFPGCEVLVGSGGSFVTAEIYVGSGGSFVKAE